MCKTSLKRMKFYSPCSRGSLTKIKLITGEREWDVFAVLFDYPIKCQCCPRIETSQLICIANQLAGFYMRATLAFNGLRSQSMNNDNLLYALKILKTLQK